MIMEKYTFEGIKKDIFEWSQKDIVKHMTQHDELEVSKNDDDILLLDLTFNNCLAQLIVSKPFFAPYQFVSFEAMTLDSEKAQYTGEPELIYFFYDSSEMTAKMVIAELEMGIQYCSCYIPNQLKKTYFNKRGTLAIEYENLHHIVHPDDIKKIKTKNVRGEFVCKDVEAQYLLVKGNTLVLRVLPKAFITID